MKTKKITEFGLFLALAFLFSYIESLIPFFIGIQGVKLGLANIVIVAALFAIGEKDAFLLSIVRIILVGFTFGNLYSLLYSMAGGLLSLAVMALSKRLKWFSIIGVSVLGGMFHNIGQLLAAIFVVKVLPLFYYLPVLIISGVLTGFAIGLTASQIVPKIILYINKTKD